MRRKLSLLPLPAWLLLSGMLSCGSDGSTDGTHGAAGATAAAASGGSGASSNAGKTSNDAGKATGGSSNGSGGAAASGAAPGGASATTGGAGHANSAGNTTLGGAAAAGSTGAGGAVTTSGPITCRAKGDGKSTITLVNHCTATLSVRGSDIQGAELAPGEHVCRDVGNAVESIPAIRFWGFIGQDPGGERYTLAELTLNTDFNDFDWYNISHVDAHNLPMQLAAVDMDKCRTLTCANSLLADCPAEGILKDKDGKVIACFSPHKDDKNSVVARYFEAGCADAYSWSGDDQGSVVACAGEDYDVVFCP